MSSKLRNIFLSKPKASDVKSAPEIEGYEKVWTDEFFGPAGAPVDAQNWDVIEKYPNYNNEIQAYTTSTENSQISGDGELHLIPKRVPQESPGGPTWTSARLEGKHGWTCEPGGKMLFQAEIKLGSNPEKRQLGIWPAFWGLGDVLKHGGGWPSCGEYDIMEVVNGSSTNHGVLHFSYDNRPDDDAGRDFNKFGRKISFRRSQYHTFSFRVDRTSNGFKTQKLSWYLDGKKYFQITGSDIGTERQWVQLAQSPFFMVLNVAIGGDFPNSYAGMGTPTDATLDGLESGMRVRYVAVYKSST